MRDFEDEFDQMLVCDTCGAQNPITKLKRQHVGKKCLFCDTNLLTWMGFVRAHMTILVAKIGLMIGWKPRGLR